MGIGVGVGAGVSIGVMTGAPLLRRGLGVRTGGEDWGTGRGEDWGEAGARMGGSVPARLRRQVALSGTSAFVWRHCRRGADLLAS